MNNIKPGWKTTEFWMTAVVIIASLAFAFDLIIADSSVDKFPGLILAAFSGFGYAISRGMAKKHSSFLNRN